MHPSRWPLVRHLAYFWLAVRAWGWWERTGKHHPSATWIEARITTYLYEVWKGLPHG